MQEPEWPLMCECKYDEVNDRMDREDCCLHCDMDEDLSLLQESKIALKKPVTIAGRDEENVA
jgi:hypothetical protein